MKRTETEIERERQREINSEKRDSKEEGQRETESQ